MDAGSPASVAVPPAPRQRDLRASHRSEMWTPAAQLLYRNCVPCSCTAGASYTNGQMLPWPSRAPGARLLQLGERALDPLLLHRVLGERQRLGVGGLGAGLVALDREDLAEA